MLHNPYLFSGIDETFYLGTMPQILPLIRNYSTEGEGLIGGHLVAKALRDVRALLTSSLPQIIV